VIDARTEERAPAGLRPLRASGLVVRHDDLVLALRTWVPALVAVDQTEQGDFLLRIDEGGADGGQAPE
jgi:hypothetical protein